MLSMLHACTAAPAAAGRDWNDLPIPPVPPALVRAVGDLRAAAFAQAVVAAYVANGERPVACRKHGPAAPDAPPSWTARLGMSRAEFDSVAARVAVRVRPGADDRARSRTGAPLVRYWRDGRRTWWQPDLDAWRALGAEIGLAAPTVAADAAAPTVTADAAAPTVTADAAAPTVTADAAAPTAPTVAADAAARACAGSMRRTGARLLCDLVDEAAELLLRGVALPGGPASVPADAPWSADDPADAPWSADDPADAPWSADDPADAPWSADDPADAPWSADDPADAPWSADDPADAPWSADDPADAPWSADDPADAPWSADDPADAPWSADDPADAPWSADDPADAPWSADDPADAPWSADDPADAPWPTSDQAFAWRDAADAWLGAMDAWRGVAECWRPDHVTDDERLMPHAVSALREADRRYDVARAREGVDGIVDLAAWRAVACAARIAADIWRGIAEVWRPDDGGRQPLTPDRDALTHAHAAWRQAAQTPLDSPDAPLRWYDAAIASQDAAYRWWRSARHACAPDGLWADDEASGVSFGGDGRAWR
jgi:hypothetical protein